MLKSKFTALWLLMAVSFSLLSQPTTTFWTHNCETMTGWSNAGTGNWALSTYAFSGTYSFETNGSSYYANNATYVLVSPAINISQYSECKLTFYAALYTENTYDGAYIEASGDGGSTWQKLYNEVLSKPYDGKLPSNNALGENLAWYNSFAWRQIVVDLKDFEGSTSFKFRISFGSDISNTNYGMNIDEIAIYGYAKTYIHNLSPTEQVVFDNSYLNVTDPKFRVSSDLAASFNRFKVEINKSATFSDISYIQEFGGSYTGGTQYTLTCNQLNPPLTFEDNQTYYVRVAASANNGASWGKWSNTISFTWKATLTSTPQWYQVADFQFNSGSLSGVSVSNNRVSYQSTLSLSRSIATTTDDVFDFYNYGDGIYYFNSSSPLARIGYRNDSPNHQYTTGLRFANVQIPKNAQINKAFLVIDCYYPHNPGYGINNNVITRIHCENSDNPVTFSSGSRPSSRSASASYVTWNLTNTVWYDHSYYETPSITSLVQSLVNRSGWASGNSMVFLIKDDHPTNLDYREIRTIDSDPSHAAKLYVEYQNAANGTIVSPAIRLASIHGATTWGRLFWDEEGIVGDFRVTIQRWNGTAWVNTALTNLDYSTSGINIASLGGESQIRLVGTFIPTGGQAPILKSWTVTTTQLTGNSDLTLSLNTTDLTPCKSSDVTFTLLVANNGPNDASNIVIDFPVPSGLTINSHSVTKGRYVSGQWQIPALQNGESVTMNLTVTVNNDQGGNNIGVNAAVNTLLQTDPNTANNSVGITLSVQNNTAPVISTISDQQTLFNTPFSTINFTVTDAETSSDALTYTAQADNSLLIPVSSMIFGGSGNNRTLNMTPGNYQYGQTLVTITVDDGGCPATKKFKAQVLRHQFSNMEAATLVVGQPDFISTEATIDASHTPGASSCVVGALGHLAVGSQHTSAFGGNDGRVMVWNSVPSTNGQSCNVVVGKSTATSSTSGCTQSLTRAVDGVAFSADGTKLLVSDASNHRVLIWNTIPTTTGQPADVVIGQTNFTSNTPGCSASKLYYPRGLFVAPDGKLFVVDGGNNRVLIFNSIPTTNGASANVVIGQDDFVTNTRGNSAKKLYSPWYCTMSTDGKLLIADTENNRVLVYNTVPQQNGAAADYVIGQEDFGISSAGLSANKLNSPIGVTVSPSGILAIGEFTNNRVLIFNSVPQTNGASADRVIGQHNFTSGVVFNDGSGNSGSAANNNLNHPYNIYFDINDRLFVNGREMNRVLVFGNVPTDQCDLQVTIASDTDSPCMGNPVTYTIEAKNNGPQNSTNVVVYAALPSGFYYYEHSAERGTYSPTGGNWQIPLLNSGETVSLTITGTVNYSMGGATIQAFASVRSNNQSETNFANNSVSKTITITSNYSPVVSRIPNQQKNVGESTGVLNFTVFDENGDPISLSATSSNQAVVPNGNIVLGGSGTNRTIQVTPNPGVHGYAIITITVTDGTCTTNQRFRVSFGNLWIGKTSDWHTAANWAGEIPKSGVDVYIPASPEGGHFPHISNNAIARDVVLEPGASLTAGNPVAITIERNLTNNGNITIQNATINIVGTGVTLSGSGKMQVHHLNLSGTITCSTNLLVSGNWNRTGSFSHTAGKVTFNGTVAQTITTPESFYSLGINNPAGVTLNQPVAVADTLEITGGILNILNALNLADDITIVRTAGSLSVMPTFLGSVNLIYKGSVTSGNEIPASRNIKNFEVSASGINVVLNGDVNVSGILTLNAGVVSTGANMLRLVNNASNSLVGGSASSFVNGTLVRYIAQNTSNYLFPISNGLTSGDYAPVVFMNNNLQGTTFLTVNVSNITVGGQNHNDFLNTDETGGNSYVGVIPDALWHINPDAQPTSGSYGVQLYFNSAVSAALSGLDNYFGILKRPSGSTSYADWNSHGTETLIPANGQPGRTVSSGYAQRIGYTSFSEFVIATSEWPLPIRLKAFQGHFVNGYNHLQWTTLSEYNNRGFILLRSIDALHFTEIARIDGAGNSSAEKNYSYLDRPEIAQNYYYKLIQVDFDGKQTEQGMVYIEMPVFSSDIQVYPNPAEQFIYIDLTAYRDASTQVSIYSVMGQDRLTNEIRLIEGHNRLKIDIGHFAPGVYLLKLFNGKEFIVRSVVKQ